MNMYKRILWYLIFCCVSFFPQLIAFSTLFGKERIELTRNGKGKQAAENICFNEKELERKRSHIQM